MAVLSQENKIIKNQSGEVFVEPNIIDISSAYGVTKDASNLVSSVKDRNQPVKFRAPAGSEPIENGDGFDFSAQTRSSLYGTKVNYLENSIELWFNLSINTAQSLMIGCYDLADSTDQFYIRVLPTSTLGVVCQSSGNALYLNNIIGDVPTIQTGEWYHLMLYTYGFEGQPQAAMYVNGKAYLTTYSISSSRTIANTPFTIGNIFGHNNAFKGKLESIKVGNKEMSKLKNSLGAGNITYSADTQVFTPPTFPNTIL